jgi:hypothetical protein
MAEKEAEDRIEFPLPPPMDEFQEKDWIVF